MKKNKYYDGTKLLSMKDLYGKTPEIFLCTSNRSAGKTTYFNRLMVNRFLKNGSKFAVLYRFTYELDDVADKFFKDIKGLFFKDYTLTEKKAKSGAYTSLFLDNKHCGYAIALNSADTIKKYSHLFSDVDSIVFDEFQSETFHYCPNETEKFISVHTSVARGQGKFSRYVPVYMISNPVTLLNPYYSAMNIAGRLNANTKFLKGDGWILEANYNLDAAYAQKESAFNRAFSSSQYFQRSSEALYLFDNYTFIEKPKGKSRYIATIRYNNINYAVREYDDYNGENIFYCDDKPDKDFPIRIVTNSQDHNMNFKLVTAADLWIKVMRGYFQDGNFRFKNLQSKEALMSTISYYH